MTHVYAVLHRTDDKHEWALFCVYGTPERANKFINRRVRAGVPRKCFKIQQRIVM